jgi:hypothetical protein
MSTGYTIELGYGDGTWQDLKDTALELCEHPILIATEALEHGAPNELEGETLYGYAEAFKHRTDLTIEFIEPGHPFWRDTYEQPFIHMMASGGDPARTMKEYVRRAFLRLLMADMHRRGMEISVRVS